MLCSFMYFIVSWLGLVSIIFKMNNEKIVWIRERRRRKHSEEGYCCVLFLKVHCKCKMQITEGRMTQCSVSFSEWMHVHIYIVDTFMCKYIQFLWVWLFEWERWWLRSQRRALFINGCLRSSAVQRSATHSAQQQYIFFVTSDLLLFSLG